MFQVGDKVECIDAEPKSDHLHGVKRGHVYVVTAVNFDGSGVQLEGMDSGFYWGWLASRFRKHIERKTDISALEKLLVLAHRKTRVYG